MPRFSWIKVHHRHVFYVRDIPLIFQRTAVGHTGISEQDTGFAGPAALTGAAANPTNANTDIKAKTNFSYLLLIPLVCFFICSRISIAPWNLKNPYQKGCFQSDASVISPSAEKRSRYVPVQKGKIIHFFPNRDSLKTQTLPQRFSLSEGQHRACCRLAAFSQQSQP